MDSSDAADNVNVINETYVADDKENYNIDDDNDVDITQAQNDTYVADDIENYGDDDDDITKGLNNTYVADKESCNIDADDVDITKGQNNTYVADKGTYNVDDDITKDQTKYAAITELISIYGATSLQQQPPPKFAAANTASIQPSSSTAAVEGDPSVELLIKERDQYRIQIEIYGKMINEIIKQHETLMEKDKQYQRTFEYFQREQQRAADTIKVINDRYLKLRYEAEQKIVQAEERISSINKQHDEDTVAMRYKLLQQDVKLKSLESQIETLQSERLGLLDMCDDLVAKSESNSEKTVTITPLKVQNL